MPKTKTIILIIALVVAINVGVYFWTRNQNAAASGALFAGPKRRPATFGESMAAPPRDAATLASVSTDDSITFFETA